MLVINMRYTYLFFLIFTFLFIGNSSSQALNAEEINIKNLKFLAQKGDGARVSITTFNPARGQKDLFTITYDYTILDILSDGYIINWKFIDAHKPHLERLIPFDKLTESVFPSVKVKLNKKFQIVEVLNWEKYQKNIAKSVVEFKEQNPKFKLLFSIIAEPYVTQEENILGLLRPITEMQVKHWSFKEDNAVAQIKRGYGKKLIGTRLISLQSLNGNSLIASVKTDYDTSNLVKSNPAMKTLKKLGKKVQMTASSSGKATFDKNTGWLISFKEKLSVAIMLGKKAHTPRVEIVELSQTRK